MAHHELPEPTQPEAAYGDKWVIRAIRQSDWLTPKYIDKIRESQPIPEKTSEGINSTYKNPFLAEFLAKGAEIDEGLIDAAYNYIQNRIVLPDGNVCPLNESPLYDDEIAAVVIELGVFPYSKLSRGTNQISFGLMCIVAPPKIRDQVVRILLSWEEGNDKIRKDVLLWSQLVKKGASEFVNKLEDQEPLGAEDTETT